MFQRLIAWIKAWFTGASAKAEVKAQELDKKVDHLKDKIDDKVDAKVDEFKDRTRDTVADRIRDYGRDEPPVKTIYVDEVKEIKANVVAEERAELPKVEEARVIPEPFVFPDANIVEEKRPVAKPIIVEPIIVEPAEVAPTDRPVQVAKPKRKRNPRAK